MRNGRWEKRKRNKKEGKVEENRSIGCWEWNKVERNEDDWGMKEGKKGINKKVMEMMKVGGKRDEKRRENY